ncbi:hypothetical protein SAMN06265220_101808 [Flavobacterium nitrogenifigens]|uniref:Uncharacterized protein n=1 Tax=Flavobacterium nitrogenifigens TaxID=1617283 RepID=A0A521BAF7_9FLAO|nr:hypothetical protein SAMN06265220_101808 [Flavobacterium nitrogenifigens]
MLKSFNYLLNNYKSTIYFIKKYLKITFISYENKKFLASPDRSDILFPAPLAGKRFNGERD